MLQFARRRRITHALRIARRRFAHRDWTLSVFGFESASAIFRFHRDGLADASPTGKAPFVGKPRTLSRFNGVNGAAFSIEKNATTVRLILQCQAIPVRSEPCVSLNEAKFRLPQVSGNSGDVFVCQPDKSGPAATICTALTDVFGIGHREFAATRLEAIEPRTIRRLCFWYLHVQAYYL